MRQPARSKAKVLLLRISTKAASALAGWYMISLITTLSCGGRIGPLYTTVTWLLAPGIGWPRGSEPRKTSWFVARASGKRSVQFVRVVQVTGHATPFTRMVWRPTGARPLNVIKLVV